jgi:hypothetical protein
MVGSIGLDVKVGSIGLDDNGIPKELCPYMIGSISWSDNGIPNELCPYMIGSIGLDLLGWMIMESLRNP